MKKGYIALFIIALVVFTAPTIVRWTYFETPGIIGFPTYYHQRMAQTIVDGNFQWEDPLSFGGRFYSYPPLFIFSIALPAFLIGVELAGLLVVAFFGASAVLLSYLIANKLIGKKHLTPFILLLTPGMIFIFSHVSSRAPPITLGLLSMYLVLKKHPRIASVVLGITSLFHIETGIVFTILTLPLLFKNKKQILPFIAIIAIIAGAWYVPFVAEHGLPQVNALHQEYRVNGWSLETPTLENYFFEIGTGYFTIPIALLALYGLWKTKNNYLKYWFLITLILTMIAERFMMYMPIPMIILAVSGLYLIIKKLKFNYGVIILAIILIYTFMSGMLYIQSFSLSYPTQEQYLAFEWINNYTNPSDTILAYWPWGHWVSGIGNRKNIIDGYAEYAPDVNQRYMDSELFFKTCSRDVLNKYSIDYIYTERWFVELKNTTCIYQFELVFNSTQSMVFKYQP